MKCSVTTACDCGLGESGQSGLETTRFIAITAAWGDAFTARPGPPRPDRIEVGSDAARLSHRLERSSRARAGHSRPALLAGFPRRQTTRVRRPATTGVRDGLSTRTSTTSMPASSKSSFACEIRPTRSSSSVRSRATTCDTFATESFGKPVCRAVSSTFPGASAHRRLLVSGTQTAVARRLRFRGSPWTMTTGRRYPGPDPAGGGNSAQRTSPWVTTIRRDREHPGRRPRGTSRRRRRSHRMRDSSRRSPRRARDARRIRRAPLRTPRSGIDARVAPVAPRARRCRREWIPPSSYP